MDLQSHLIIFSRASVYLRALIILSLPLSACSSCSSNGNATPDGGDTDSDSDTDADTDSDSDTDSDTDTGPYTTDAGPWEWQDNPDGGEDCGPGCRQVTFSDDVRANEWDVWEDIVVFSGDFRRIYATNYLESETLIVPQVHANAPIQGSQNGALLPAFYENKLVYQLFISSQLPPRSELVVADFSQHVQKVVWQRDELGTDDDAYGTISSLDIHGTAITSSAGCGTPTNVNLCTYPAPYPTDGVALIDGYFVVFTTVWDNKLVFLDATEWPTHDVRGYDLDAEEFFDVTDDDYYQNTPRIGSDKVVWQDFRYSDYAPWEKHSNTVIFAKDLDTGVTTQLTDGSAIAASPDVHGDVAVWLDWRHCADPQGDVYMDFECAEVYGHNLATATEARITNIPDRAKSTPRIWGDRVFVEMKTEAGSAIFMIDLPAQLK